MAHLDPILTTAHLAEPHRSTAAAILRAAEQGLFTVTEAEMMIDRVRTHVPPAPWPQGDLVFSGSGQETGPGSPDRTVI